MYDGSSKPLVLIVDDEPDHAWPLTQLLADEVHSVVAFDWKQALDKVSTHPVDLILMDVGMPVMDGFAVCERLKQDPTSADIPVIFVSGRTHDKDEERGFAVGGVDYVHKPYLPALIRARVRAHLRLRQVTRSLERRANTDGLTGLPNRSAIDECIERECRRSQEEAGALSLLLIDLDHFKLCNDTHGHQAGDEVLRQVGNCLESMTRAGDFVGRWGGEEFVLLSHCGLEGAMALSERIRGAIAALETGYGRVTASIGVGRMARDERAVDLFARVDQALLTAKGEGRNRVVVAAAAWAA